MVRSCLWMSELTRAYSAAFLSMKSVGILRRPRRGGDGVSVEPGIFPEMGPMTCRLFIDEVGNDDTKTPSERYLSLTGIITKVTDTTPRSHPQSKS